MSELQFDRHLTRDKISDLAATTHAGMAHFAHTGPAGKTCRQCVFWGIAAGYAYLYYAKGGTHGAALKDHPCRKYRALTGCQGNGVPHNASACRYFEEDSAPPPIIDPRVTKL